MGFRPFVNFCYVFLCFLTVYHGFYRYVEQGRDGSRWSTHGGSKSRYGSVPFGPRSIPGPSRSDGVPRVSHVLIKDRDVFPVPSRLSADETWTPDSFGARLGHGIKRAATKQSQSLYSDNLNIVCETTTCMTKTKTILCLCVCWVHTFMRAATKRRSAAAVAERESRTETKTKKEVLLGA